MSNLSQSVNVAVLDNRDSFVYNLVDELVGLGLAPTVFRNNVPAADIVATEPDLIVLSPGPGHPAEAGCMMELIAGAQVPMLGICLGFQALLLEASLTVRPVGPVHGTSDTMRVPGGVSRETRLVDALFRGARNPDGTVTVARYHSLGVPVAEVAPGQITVLGECDSEAGPVVMAAAFGRGAPGTAREGEATDPLRAIGLQFHPESILTPKGPLILRNAIEMLTECGAQN